MSLTQKTIRAGLWALVQNGGRQVISTLVFLALARFFLTKDEFGLVALATLLITFLNVLVRQGLGTAIIQRREVRDIHLDTAFWANVATAIVLTAGVVAASDTLAHLLGDPRVSPILEVLSIGMVITSLSLTHEAILSRELQFKSLAIRTLVASLASAAAGIGFALAGGGLWALVAMQLAAAMSGLLVLWWASHWRPRLRFSAGAFRELLPMSASMTGVAIVSALNDLVDQFVIGRMLGTPSLGVYVVAQKVVKLLVTVFVQAFSSVALPSFSRLDGDRDRIRNAFLRATRMATFVSFPVFLGLAVTADLVVPLMFGDGWGEAPVVMSILCLWAVVGSVNYFFAPVLLAAGRGNEVFMNTLLGAGLLIVFALLGAEYGVAGVAAGVLLKSVFMMPLWLRQLRAHVGVTGAMLIGAFGGNLLAASLMALSTLMVRSLLTSGHVVEMSVSLLVGMAAYAILSMKLSNAAITECMSLARLAIVKRDAKALQGD